MATHLTAEERESLIFEGLKLVRGELHRYQGEEIVAGEHPLHKAVVAVECYCRPRKSKHDLMFSPAGYLWLALLDRSRGFTLRPFKLRQLERHGIEINPDIPVTMLAALLFMHIDRTIFDGPHRRDMIDETQRHFEADWYHDYHNADGTRKPWETIERSRQNRYPSKG